jgi:hypothetical protein
MYWMFSEVAQYGLCWHGAHFVSQMAPEQSVKCVVGGCARHAEGSQSTVRGLSGLFVCSVLRVVDSGPIPESVVECRALTGELANRTTPRSALHGQLRCHDSGVDGTNPGPEGIDQVLTCQATYRPGRRVFLLCRQRRADDFFEVAPRGWITAQD